MLTCKWADQKLSSCLPDFTTKCRMSPTADRSWYQKKATSESKTHLNQRPDFYSKQRLKWNFILANKNTGMLKLKCVGEKVFYLTFNQIRLTCSYCQSVRMNKMWSTLLFLDYFFFMFHLWLLFGFHRPIIKRIPFAERFKSFINFPKGLSSSYPFTVHLGRTKAVITFGFFNSSFI